MAATKETTNKLGEYRRERGFDSTPEPKLDGTARGARARFVVHEHHARRLHWDLRLEHDGALASWAIPNGIPEDPQHNRKAVHVEDHPLSYIDFQGTIPAGNYGAGQVTIWDEGTYESEKWEPGKIVVVFHGQQLQGRYALFRAGRTEKDWMIHRMDPSADSGAQEMPEGIQSMLARLSTLPAGESEWALEVKWDGVRAITRSQSSRISFISRNGNDVTAAYPELLPPPQGSFVDALADKGKGCRRDHQRLGALGETGEKPLDRRSVAASVAARTRPSADSDSASSAAQRKRSASISNASIIVVSSAMGIASCCSGSSQPIKSSPRKAAAWRLSTVVQHARLNDSGRAWGASSHARDSSERQRSAQQQRQAAAASRLFCSVDRPGPGPVGDCP